MISVHNVPYALQRIRYIFKQQICRLFASKDSGNFKEQSTSCIGKALSLTSDRKALAGEACREEVKVRHSIWVDDSCILVVHLAFMWCVSCHVA